MENRTGDRLAHFNQEMSLKELTPKVAALLCYVAGWITGIVFLILEQKNIFVRFHALQSIIVFGALTATGTILNHIPILGSGLSITIFVLGFSLWLLLMIKALEGIAFKLPWAGNLAEKLAMESISSVEDKHNLPGEDEALASPPIQPNQNSPQSAAVAPKAKSDHAAYEVSHRERFQEKYYSFSRHTARIVGSSFTIAWCIALIVFFNFFNQYIAYYQPIYSAGVTHWQISTLVTSDFNDWLPILNTTIAFTILVHAILIVYDKYLLRQAARLVLGIFGLATVISLLVMFPFDFNVIPNADANYWGPLGLALTLILTAIGIGISVVARFIKIVIHAIEGRY
jgi:uncharacterized membrane protein